jgi:tRNA-specific 2-thiouridylase
MFPLGAMMKPDVRRLAAELGIPVSEKPDSQEICFVPNGDYAAFIDAYFAEQGLPREAASGEIVDLDGKVLGRHSGTHHYTVGQRKGLRVAAPEPLYVIATNPATQQVIVGRDGDLNRGSFTARGVNWLSIPEPAEEIAAEVRIRNKHQPAAAVIRALPGERAEVHFSRPQRAVTPGQAVVFYRNGLVLGGGWIE